jgi:hypothetical protein
MLLVVKGGKYEVDPTYRCVSNDSHTNRFALVEVGEDGNVGRKMTLPSSAKHDVEKLMGKYRAVYVHDPNKELKIPQHGQNADELVQSIRRHKSQEEKTHLKTLMTHTRKLMSEPENKFRSSVKQDGSKCFYKLTDTENAKYMRAGIQNSNGLCSDVMATIPKNEATQSMLDRTFRGLTNMHKHVKVGASFEELKSHIEAELQDDETILENPFVHIGYSRVDPIKTEGDVLGQHDVVNINVKVGNKNGVQAHAHGGLLSFDDSVSYGAAPPTAPPEEIRDIWLTGDKLYNNPNLLGLYYNDAAVNVAAPPIDIALVQDVYRHYNLTVPVNVNAIAIGPPRQWQPAGHTEFIDLNQLSLSNVMTQDFFDLEKLIAKQFQNFQLKNLAVMFQGNNPGEHLLTQLISIGISFIQHRYALLVYYFNRDERMEETIRLLLTDMHRFTELPTNLIKKLGKAIYSTYDSHPNAVNSKMKDVAFLYDLFNKLEKLLEDSPPNDELTNVCILLIKIIKDLFTSTVEYYDCSTVSCIIDHEMEFYKASRRMFIMAKFFIQLLGIRLNGFKIFDLFMGGNLDDMESDIEYVEPNLRMDVVDDISATYTHVFPIPAFATSNDVPIAIAEFKEIAEAERLDMDDNPLPDKFIHYFYPNDSGTLQYFFTMYNGQYVTYHISDVNNHRIEPVFYYDDVISIWSAPNYTYYKNTKYIRSDFHKYNEYVKDFHYYYNRFARIPAGPAAAPAAAPPAAAPPVLPGGGGPGGSAPAAIGGDQAPAFAFANPGSAPPTAAVPPPAPPPAPSLDLGAGVGLRFSREAPRFDPAPPAPAPAPAAVPQSLTVQLPTAPAPAPAAANVGLPPPNPEMKRLKEIIEQNRRQALGLGPSVQLDEDGNPIESAPTGAQN